MTAVINFHILLSLILFSGHFDGIFQNLSNSLPKRTAFLKSFTQKYFESDIDVLKNDDQWHASIPNEESGPCYTYDPPFDSQLAETSNMFIEFNMSTWDPLLEVFLHDKNQLFYSRKTSINTKFISSNMLRATALNHPRALSKHCFRIN